MSLKKEFLRRYVVLQRWFKSDVVEEPVLDTFFYTVLSRRVGDACLYAFPYRDAKKHSFSIHFFAQRGRAKKHSNGQAVGIFARGRQKNTQTVKPTTACPVE